MSAYDDKFFSGLETLSDTAAPEVLSIVWTYLKPQSVVDFGCGTGGWLSAAQSLGATDVCGLDGDWVPRNRLAISPGSFIPIDLECATLPLDRNFDLAISLEVLEHLSPLAGDRAVKWLCQRASVVLFSAAIPGQSGTHHVNEDWLSNWAGKFSTHGFALFDLIRPRIWRIPHIPVWYRQNVVLFTRPETAQELGMGLPTTGTIDIVHPLTFAAKRPAANRSPYIVTKHTAKRRRPMKRLARALARIARG